MPQHEKRLMLAAYRAGLAARWEAISRLPVRSNQRYRELGKLREALPNRTIPPHTGAIVGATVGTSLKHW